MTRRGPLFRLLHLERTPCPSCHRDAVYRFGSPPNRCRWCGTSWVDWPTMARNVAHACAAMMAMSQAATAAMDEMIRAVDLLTRPATYVVDVETATHDDLRSGDIATGLARYSVDAYDGWEAKLLACQMASREGRMPTRATLVANP